MLDRFARRSSFASYLNFGIVALLLLVIILPGCGGGADYSGGTGGTGLKPGGGEQKRIIGTVINNAGTPIANLPVRISESSAEDVTDEQGEFEILSEIIGTQVTFDFDPENSSDSYVINDLPEGYSTLEVILRRGSEGVSADQILVDGVPFENGSDSSDNQENSSQSESDNNSSGNFNSSDSSISDGTSSGNTSSSQGSTSSDTGSVSSSSEGGVGSSSFSSTTSSGGSSSSKGYRTAFGPEYSVPYVPITEERGAQALESLPFSPIAVELNDDSRVDMIVPGTNGSVVVMINLPGLEVAAVDSPTVAGQAAIDLGANQGAAVQQVLISDFDQDGDLDLLLALASEMLFAANQGNGSFVPAVRLGLGLSQSIAAVATGDIDEDGVEDLVIALTNSLNPNGPLELAFFRNAKTEGLSQLTNLVTDINKLTLIQVTDVNHDGINEIVAIGNTETDAGLVTVYGKRAVGANYQPIQQNLSVTADLAVLANLIGDDDLEIVIASSNTRVFVTETNISIVGCDFENQSLTLMPKTINLGTMTEIKALNAGPLDALGYEELVIGSAEEFITIYPDASGSFKQDTYKFAMPRDLRGLSIVDYNQDQQADLMVFDNSVSSYFINVNATLPLFGDPNCDGRLDNGDIDQLASFVSSGEAATSTTACPLSWSDMDQNGELDSRDTDYFVNRLLSR